MPSSRRALQSFHNLGWQAEEHGNRSRDGTSHDPNPFLRYGSTAGFFLWPEGKVSHDSPCFRIGQPCSDKHVG